MIDILAFILALFVVAVGVFLAFVVFFTLVIGGMLTAERILRACGLKV